MLGENRTRFSTTGKDLEREREERHVGGWEEERTEDLVDFESLIEKLNKVYAQEG